MDSYHEQFELHYAFVVTNHAGSHIFESGTAPCEVV